MNVCLSRVASLTELFSLDGWTTKSASVQLVKTYDETEKRNGTI